MPALLRLLDELDRFQGEWRVFAPRPEYRQQVGSRYREALGDPATMHLVAEEAGEVVGMARGEVVRPSSLSDEEALEISSVFVLETHRGRGIAKALVEGLFQFARERGLRRATLKTFAGNDPALAFWERLGFRPRLVQMTAAVDDTSS